MEHFQKTLFLNEIQAQCKFAKRAYSSMLTALKSKPDDTTTSDVWYHCQNLFVALGNLSKIFFPQRNKRKYVSRAKYLREQFQIDDKSPLADNGEYRIFRNQCEHFDEYIQAWIDAGHEMVMDRNVNVTVIYKGKPVPAYRNFLLNEDEVIIESQGQKISLRPIPDLLDDLNTRVDKLIKEI